MNPVNTFGALKGAKFGKWLNLLYSPCKVEEIQIKFELCVRISASAGSNENGVSPHKRGIRNGPKALKPAPVIMRCKPTLSNANTLDVPLLGNKLTGSVVESNYHISSAAVELSLLHLMLAEYERLSCTKEQSSFVENLFFPPSMVLVAGLSSKKKAGSRDGAPPLATFYVGLSANGAIIHYKPEPDSCSVVDGKELFLLDSGGQYIDGTTDITRTVHFGEPSARERECFTRVLQGHIALDQAVFPENTPGFVLDAFARSSLWKVGLDYRHGTGHGVGAALNVHEGPHSISFRFGNMTPLLRGMIVSNEPGYYEDHQFGIRIEVLSPFLHIPYL
uniref:Probable Xaa-Pro aminopeptidase P n=1 Tax=Nicotiana tabacum TaxID=4097 RepID=A0A1S3XUZ9_TOBAC|nr:PREDICTED: probable Xaa-Pro aminopeptidase P [Nicotiana tabacum]